MKIPPAAPPSLWSRIVCCISSKTDRNSALSGHKSDNATWGVNPILGSSWLAVEKNKTNLGWWSAGDLELEVLRHEVIYDDDHTHLLKVLLTQYDSFQLRKVSNQIFEILIQEP